MTDTIDALPEEDSWEAISSDAIDALREAIGEDGVSADLGKLVARASALKLHETEEQDGEPMAAIIRVQDQLDRIPDDGKVFVDVNVRRDDLQWVCDAALMGVGEIPSIGESWPNSEAPVAVHAMVEGGYVTPMPRDIEISLDELRRVAMAVMTDDELNSGPMGVPRGLRYAMPRVVRRINFVMDMLGVRWTLLRGQMLTPMADQPVIDDIMPLDAQFSVREMVRVEREGGRMVRVKSKSGRELGPIAPTPMFAKMEPRELAVFDAGWDLVTALRGGGTLPHKDPKQAEEEAANVLLRHLDERNHSKGRLIERSENDGA